MFAAVAVMHRRRRIVMWLAIACFASGVVVSALRIVKYHQTPGPFDPARQGYCDFHNGVYFPALAFREGVSPYSMKYAETYPIERPIPFYSPCILALHAPLTLLPLAIAEVVYFVISLALLLLIAYLSVAWAQRPGGCETVRFDWVWITACGLLLTRGGQQTIFTGYFTLELILGALLAVQYATTRLGWSVFGLVLISAKPTFVLPIAGLMLVRGNVKAVTLAGILSVALAAVCFGWLLQGGSIAQMQTDIAASQAVHRDDAYELPVNTWTRLDVLAIVAKWTDWTPNDTTHLIAMIVLLLPSAILLAIYHRRVDDPGQCIGLSGAIVLITSLLAIYHQVYDAMLLTPVIVAMWIGNREPWQSMSFVFRWGLIACMLLPAVNYLSSLMLLNALHIDGIAKQIVTSFNTLALVSASVMLLVVAWNRSRLA